MKKYFSKITQRNVFKTHVPQMYYISEVEEEAVFHPRLLHSHDDFVELILIVAGKADYLIEEREYRVGAGDLIVINRNTLHDEKIIDHSRFKSYCVAIKGLQLPGCEPNILLPNQFEPILATGDYFFELRDLFEMLLSHVRQGEERSNLIADGIFQSILTLVYYGLIAENGGKPPKEENPNKANVIQRVKQYIDENFAENLKLSDLADYVNSSQYYVAHLFRQELGVSPGQYIIRRRIGEAQTLLLTTNQSISYIASSVGYDSVNQFNTLFKKKVGMAPTAYRKEYLNYNEE